MKRNERRLGMRPIFHAGDRHKVGLPCVMRSIVVMQRVRQELVEIALPVVIHEMPPTSKGNGENALFQQVLCESCIKILPAFIKGPRLIPVNLPVTNVVTPNEGVIMQCKFIAKLADGIAMIF